MIPALEFNVIDRFGLWPAFTEIDNRDIGVPDDWCARWNDRTWRVDLSPEGILSIRRSGEAAFDDGQSLPIYYSDDLQQLQRLQAFTCHAEGRDPRLTAENGVPHSWAYFPIPGTRWQLNAAQRIWHLLTLQRPEAAQRQADVFTDIVTMGAARVRDEGGWWQPQLAAETIERAGQTLEYAMRYLWRAQENGSPAHALQQEAESLANLMATAGSVTGTLCRQSPLDAELTASGSLGARDNAHHELDHALATLRSVESHLRIAADAYERFADAGQRPEGLVNV